MGGCHSNLNRQTRNEFHHQGLASIKLSLTVGKAPQWEVASPCSWELLLPIQHQLPPSQWTQRHAMSDGMAKQKPGGGTASVAPREGMKITERKGLQKPPTKQRARSTTSEVHHSVYPEGAILTYTKRWSKVPHLFPGHSLTSVFILPLK